MKRQNKFILNHYPRKYGKTHILVNEMYNYIYKTNTYKRILIYAENEEQVEYISDIITCNLDYQYETTKRFKGKTNNKFINKNYVIIVGTYKFFLKNRKRDDCVNLVLFDELPKEDDFLYMDFIISKYPIAEFRTYYTSKIGPFDKTIFYMLLENKRVSEKTIEKLINRFGEDKVFEEFDKLKKTIYDLDIEFIFKEKNTINNFFKKIETLNQENLTIRNTIERVLYSSVDTMKVNYFGMLFTNNFRDKQISKLYDEFFNKIREEKK